MQKVTSLLPPSTASNSLLPRVSFEWSSTDSTSVSVSLLIPFPFLPHALNHPFLPPSLPPLVQKIADLEAEYAKTQKNKATNYHLGLIKAKLAKLRRELIEPTGGGGGKGGDGFDVAKSGDTRVGLVGFPSVGKSTLLTKLTGTFSEAASYEFTTLTAIPGTLHYRGARIQIVDLPGIIEGAKDGKGKSEPPSPSLPPSLPLALLPVM